MKTPIFSRLTVIWLLLVAATLLTWTIGHGEDAADVRWPGVVVIAISLIKVRMVVLDFMEVRHAPRPLRWALEVWLVGLGLVLVALLLCAQSLHAS